MTFRLHTSLVLLVLVLALASSRSDLSAVLTTTGADDRDIVPSDASITVLSASPDELVRLGRAVSVFNAGSLELPALEISFPTDPASCGNAHGGFHASEDVMQIRICSPDNDWVYLHELAHAWERARVNDEQRTALLELRGLGQWRDPDAPWNERGVEWAAVAIQQGLAGLPLPPVLGTETISRLKAYELLTGQVAPNLVSWVNGRSVLCDERPTDLSRPLTDANGLMCG